MNAHKPNPAFLLLLPVLLLSACATTPAPTFDTIGVDPFLTPQGTTADPKMATGKSVQWGGSIIGVTNLPERTRIEVLAYPLDSKVGEANYDQPVVDARQVYLWPEDQGPQGSGVSFGFGVGSGGWGSGSSWGVGVGTGF